MGTVSKGTVPAGTVVLQKHNRPRICEGRYKARSSGALGKKVLENVPLMDVG
jgi:hypothetical protein